VAVTLTFAASRGHALIGRALYLPEACAADEEHRELAGVPEEVMFATKPQLAGDLLDRAMLEVAGDDTPGGHDGGHSVLLARRHRYTGQLSYYRCWTPGPVPLSKLIAVASARWRVEEDHQLSKQAAGLDSGQVICWTSWHRWTAVCLLAYLYLAVAVALQRQQEASSGLDAGLIPVTVPELLRLLRDPVIPPPRRGRAHRLHWSEWRCRHQHRAREAHRRWNAYAEKTP
jgi:hypothetical protein